MSIKVDQLSIGFKNKPLYSNISFELKPGDLCAIIGANGAGKTSLIRSLSGSLKPLSGTRVLNNKPLENYSVKELARYMSLVSTERVRLGYFKVIDVLELGRYPYTAGIMGKLNKQDRLIIDQAIAATSIEPLLQKSMDQLSEGERQKVMICRALVQNTPYILMDEPSAFLDMLNRLELFRLLKKLSEQSDKAILIASHEVDLCLKIANKLVILAEQCYVLSPQEAIRSGILEKLFQSPGLRFENGRFEFDS